MRVAPPPPASGGHEGRHSDAERSRIELRLERWSLVTGTVEAMGLLQARTNLSFKLLGLGSLEIEKKSDVKVNVKTKVKYKTVLLLHLLTGFFRLRHYAVTCRMKSDMDLSSLLLRSLSSSPYLYLYL